MDSYGGRRGGGGFTGIGRGFTARGGHKFTPSYQKPPSTNIPYETNKCKWTKYKSVAILNILISRLKFPGKRSGKFEKIRSIFEIIYGIDQSNRPVGDYQMRGLERGPLWFISDLNTSFAYFKK